MEWTRVHLALPSSRARKALTTGACEEVERSLIFRVDQSRAGRCHSFHPPFAPSLPPSTSRSSQQRQKDDQPWRRPNREPPSGSRPRTEGRPFSSCDGRRRRAAGGPRPCVHGLRSYDNTHVAPLPSHRRPTVQQMRYVFRESAGGFDLAGGQNEVVGLREIRESCWILTDVIHTMQDSLDAVPRLRMMMHHLQHFKPDNKLPSRRLQDYSSGHRTLISTTSQPPSPPSFLPLPPLPPMASPLCTRRPPQSRRPPRLACPTLQMDPRTVSRLWQHQLDHRPSRKVDLVQAGESATAKAGRCAARAALRTTTV
jgi:hypothetical protein